MTKLNDKFQNGTHISILVGHATAHCALATSMLHGTVEDTTAKAVKLTVYTEVEDKPLTVWFPRKALVRDIGKGNDINCKLAHWFRPSGWTARVIELASHHSVLSA